MKTAAVYVAILYVGSAAVYIAIFALKKDALYTPLLHEDGRRVYSHFICRPSSHIL